MIEHKIKKDDGCDRWSTRTGKRSMKTRRIYVPQLRAVFLFYKLRKNDHSHRYEKRV